jgi:hypothetical protein
MPIFVPSFDVTVVRVEPAAGGAWRATTVDADPDTPPAIASSTTPDIDHQTHDDRGIRNPPDARFTNRPNLAPGCAPRRRSRG